MPRRKPLPELDDDQTAAQMDEGFVHALMLGANAAKLDCGDVAALAALDLIAGLAAFDRAPLNVVIATLGEAAKTREAAMREAWSRKEGAPPLSAARLSPLVIAPSRLN